MTPDKILGWSIENGRRSHLIGTADIVVGIRIPAVVTMASSLCGTPGHGGSVQALPNTIPCSRCLSIAFALARKDALPDMEVLKRGEVRRA